MSKASVLFLCSGNACRSQMAEGWARALHAQRIEAFSAGIEPAQQSPADEPWKGIGQADRLAAQQLTSLPDRRSPL